MTNSNNKVLCFGELLLRLVPTLNQQWINNKTINIYIGGAEHNVASALAAWNNDVEFFSCIPQNELFSEIITDIRDRNINCDKFLFRDGRIGTYYLPKGSDLKNNGVVYDRTNSSFSNLKLEDFDWNLLFQNVGWFHISTITPPLSDNLADICQRAVQEATKRNITTSIDLNYRSKLWSNITQPSKTITPIVLHCDVVMGNIWSVNSLLDIEIDNDSMEKEDYFTTSKICSKHLLDKFPDIKTIAFTFRFENEKGELKYNSYLNNGSNDIFSNQFHIHNVIDKVGSGDCFMAGLIHGLIANKSNEGILEFCNKAAVSKLCEEGDHTRRSIVEIEIFISNTFKYENDNYYQN